MSAFVKVTAAREDSEISAVLAAEEWETLKALAEALPNDLTWSAKPNPGLSHRSASEETTQ